MAPRVITIAWAKFIIPVTEYTIFIARAMRAYILPIAKAEMK